MSAAENIVDFVRGFGQRKRASEIKDQLKNYLTAPESTITAINQIDPATGIALNQQHTAEVAQQQATQQTTQKRSLDAFGQVTGFLRSARDNGATDLGAALDGLAPFIKSTLGADDNQIGQWKQALAANPGLVDTLDTEGQKARAKLAGDVHVVGPGAALAVGGKVTYSQPSAPKVLAVPNSSGGRDVITVDPNNPPIGTPGTGTGTGSALTADTLLPHFVAQESGGDYGTINKDTGALGKYQVMPATAQKLAKSLGMAYRPDMLRGTDQASRNYQDAIGKAAVQEAVDHSGGDPAAAFSYYYSGSPTAYKDAKGNPKTARYVQDMLTRTSGAAPAGGPAPAPGGVRPVYSTSGPSKQVRAATPEEIASAGYPAGTAAQIDANGKMVNLKTPSATTTKDAKLATTQLRTAQSTAENLDRLGSFVDALAKDPALDSATGNIYGRLPAGLLGQGAVDFEKKLTSLRQNIGLTALQQFKSLSASGASGFGNLSNEEGRRLESMFGVLDRTASPTLIRSTLGDIAKFVRDHNSALKAGIADKAQGLPAGGTPGSAASPPIIGAKAYKKDAQGKITATVQWNGRGWVPVRN